MAKRKYYVVWAGHHPGIYDSWEECKHQTQGFEGARFKSFESLAEARDAFEKGPGAYIGKKKPTGSPQQLLKVGHPIKASLSVDAACSGNPGVLEYQGVNTASKEQIFQMGPFPHGTVNIGEFLALVHGLAYLKQIKSSVPVYSDSVTAMAWVRKKKIETNLERTAETEELFQLVDRAIMWLHKNSWDNKILKWHTEVWGEIPADFGRK